MKTIITGMVMLLVCLGAWSQEYDGTEAILSKKDVSHFIEHFPELEKAFEDGELEFDAQGGSDYLYSEAYLEKANRIVNKHGYADFNDFIMKTMAIALSYTSIKLDENMSEASPEIAAAIAAIDENPNLTPEQKAAYKQQMEQTIDAMKNVETSAAKEDIEVVRGFMPQLESLFED